VVQRIQQIDAEAASLAQQYGQSEVALDTARQAQAALSAAVLEQQNRVSQLQIGITQLVNTQRQDPGFGAALNFVVAESPEDFISSMATSNSIESILEEQAARFKSEQSRMTDLTLQLDAQVENIEEQVELQQQLISQQEAKAAQARAALKSLNETQLARVNNAAGEQDNILPLLRPTNGPITSPYGWRESPVPELHEGNDFGSPCGTPIKAAANGKVVFAGWNTWFGNYVVIDHGRVGTDYFRTGYAHQSDFIVANGDPVLRGQIIGFVGDTGFSFGCHVHFNVIVNGKYVDGRYYLS
jgi:murein DD-endopeptidase MepM/ murein hydrolase activator NlpD